RRDAALGGGAAGGRAARHRHQGGHGRGRRWREPVRRHGARSTPVGGAAGDNEGDGRTSGRRGRQVEDPLPLAAEGMDGGVSEVKLEDITVEVRDKDLNRVGIIKHEELDLKATDKHNNVGEWELTLPAEHRLVPTLLEP